MKIALGAEHGGVDLKDTIREHLEGQGHEVHDFGTRSRESTDYPDYAGTVGEAVARGEFDRGILSCGTARAWPSRPTRSAESARRYAWRPSRRA